MFILTVRTQIDLHKGKITAIIFIFMAQPIRDPNDDIMDERGVTEFKRTQYTVCDNQVDKLETIFRR